MNSKNLLVEKYLEQHSVVESNILSFNDFIQNRIQQIVNEVNESISNEEVEIRLGKIRIEKPNIIESDGSSSVVNPTIARIRNLTYSSPVFAELSVRYGDQTDSAEVEIGRIPVMAKSSACTTYGMNKEELANSYADPMDPGGYFIINGNERV